MNEPHRTKELIMPRGTAKPNTSKAAKPATKKANAKPAATKTKTTKAAAAKPAANKKATAKTANKAAAKKTNTKAASNQKVELEQQVAAAEAQHEQQQQPTPAPTPPVVEAAPVVLPAPVVQAPAVVDESDDDIPRGVKTFNKKYGDLKGPIRSDNEAWPSEILKGMRFGKLVVIGRDEAVKKGPESLIKCQCDCGTLKWARVPHLKARTTTSCGCAAPRRAEGQASGRLTKADKMVVEMTDSDGNLSRLSLREAAEQTGIPLNAVMLRLKNKWEMKDIFSVPIYSEAPNKGTRNQKRLNVRRKVDVDPALLAAVPLDTKKEIAHHLNNGVKPKALAQDYSLAMDVILAIPESLESAS